MIPFSEDWATSNAERENKEDLVPTPHEVELVDLTYLDDEVNCGIGSSGCVDSDNGFSNQNERRSVGFEQSVSMRASLEDTRDESSNQPSSSEGGKQENGVAIEDSQLETDTDEGCPREDGMGTKMGDQLEVSGISNMECRGRECPIVPEDAIKSEAVDGAGIQATGLPRHELTSTPPTGSSTMNTEQPTQEASGYSLLKVPTYQPQRPMQKEAEWEGKLPMIENTNSSSSSSSSSGSGSDTDDDDKDDSDDHLTQLTRKRKCSCQPTGI